MKRLLSLLLIFSMLGCASEPPDGYPERARDKAVSKGDGSPSIKPGGDEQTVNLTVK